MRTASLVNHLMGGSKSKQPEIGDGATILMWTDRTACTIVNVNGPSMQRNRVRVQEDKATRTDANGMSDAQAYRYERNPEGATYIFTLRKNGAWVKEGESMGNGRRLLIGVRQGYHDYSF